MKKYDWKLIQQDYDNGFTFRTLLEKYGMANRSLTLAVKRGDLISRSHTEAATFEGSKAWYNSLKVKNQNKFNITNKRKSIKIKLFLAFGKRCACCGLEDEPEYIYDFHHKNPEDKDFQIAGITKAWDRMVVEASKCVMVCVMCHRKIHNNDMKIPDDHPVFNQSLITDEKVKELFSRYSQKLSINIQYEN
jgi:hypothetical protein